jgi:hypothetical protein
MNDVKNTACLHDVPKYFEVRQKEKFGREIANFGHVAISRAGQKPFYRKFFGGMPQISCCYMDTERVFEPTKKIPVEYFRWFV